PTGVQGTAGHGEVSLSWSAPASDGGSPITGYVVQDSTDGGAHWTSVATAAGTSTTVTGLVAGTAYVFRVAAVNAAGTGPFSAASAPVTPTAVAPGAPTGVTATAGDGQATVSWTPPSNNGGSAVTGYDVQYSSDGGSNWTSASNAFHTSTATTQTVTGLANGTSYVFRVAALNAAGTGAYSTASAPVTPKAAAATPDHTTLSGGGSRHIRYGDSIKLSTSLTDTTAGQSIADAPVQLLGRLGRSGAWSVVRHLTTTSSGRASVTVRPEFNAQYEWSFAGTDMQAPATSRVETVTVAQKVTAHLTKHRAKAGSTVQIYGTVELNSEGERVRLQQRRHGRWVSTHVAATIRYQRLPDGSRTLGYILTVSEPKARHYVFRVRRPATANNAAGTSRTLHLTVT
ncbi:MAG TPA: fibronectin type III domain-containing protein, partial [Mycobacteriales bacterium]|nr:fibronectin type III domain-containing protein [Mycobacteriales bacterium]